MISFRLTAEEYDRFRELCYSTGIRSVSEMARTAIHMMLSQPTRAPHETLENRISELESRLQFLSLEVKRLHQDPGHGLTSDVVIGARTA